MSAKRRKKYKRKGAKEDKKETTDMKEEHEVQLFRQEISMQQKVETSTETQTQSSVLIQQNQKNFNVVKEDIFEESTETNKEDVSRDDHHELSTNEFVEKEKSKNQFFLLGTQEKSSVLEQESISATEEYSLQAEHFSIKSRVQEVLTRDSDLETSSAKPKESEVEKEKEKEKEIYTTLELDSKSRVETFTEKVSYEQQVYYSGQGHEEDREEVYHVRVSEISPSQSTRVYREESMDSSQQHDSKSDEIDELLLLVMPPGHARLNVEDQDESEFDHINAPRIIVTPTFDDYSDNQESFNEEYHCETKPFEIGEENPANEAELEIQSVTPGSDEKLVLTLTKEIEQAIDAKYIIKIFFPIKVQVQNSHPLGKPNAIMT